MAGFAIAQFASLTSPFTGSARVTNPRPALPQLRIFNLGTDYGLSITMGVGCPGSVLCIIDALAIPRLRDEWTAG